jgi:hypothetical protein
MRHDLLLREGTHLLAPRDAAGKKEKGGAQVLRDTDVDRQALLRTGWA